MIKKQNSLAYGLGFPREPHGICPMGWDSGPDVCTMSHRK